MKLSINSRLAIGLLAIGLLASALATNFPAANAAADVQPSSSMRAPASPIATSLSPLSWGPKAWFRVTSESPTDITGTGEFLLVLPDHVTSNGLPGFDLDAGLSLVVTDAQWDAPSGEKIDLIQTGGGGTLSYDTIVTAESAKLSWQSATGRLVRGQAQVPTGLAFRARSQPGQVTMLPRFEISGYVIQNP